MPLTDPEIGDLNLLGVNCLRKAPAAGHVDLGRADPAGQRRARLGVEVPAGAAHRAVPRRVSLFRGTQWVVFEPNDEPLWAQIRLNVGAFMDTLFRQGAFAGHDAEGGLLREVRRARPRPRTTSTSAIVNIWVGFAPLKPAEFVVIHLQQMAGQAGGA